MFDTIKSIRDLPVFNTIIALTLVSMIIFPPYLILLSFDLKFVLDAEFGTVK